MSTYDTDERGTPITSRTLITWGGFLLAAVGTLITCIWVIAGMQSKTAILGRDVQANQLRIVALEGKERRDEFQAGGDEHEA